MTDVRKRLFIAVKVGSHSPRLRHSPDCQVKASHDSMHRSTRFQKARKAQFSSHDILAHAKGIETASKITVGKRCRHKSATPGDMVSS